MSDIIPITHFYTCEAHLADLLDRRGRQMAFRARTAKSALSWQTKLRAKVAQVLGLPEMESCEPVVKITEFVQKEGYRRERVELQTEPGVWTIFYALIPDDLHPGERRPLVLAPHGHCSGGKFATAGRTDIPRVAETIRESNYTYGEDFVRAGWVVFCPDARGFGERRESTSQNDARFLEDSCTQLNNMAIPLGLSVAGMWVWDLMRLIDYGLTRPEVDGNRIACAGLSGGGLQTLYLSALDLRVKLAVISGYFYGIKDALLHLPNCSCNYVPGMWKLADMGDIGALIAPRPLLIETGDADFLNGARGLANVTEQVAITRRAYQLLGAEDKLNHVVCSGGHQWYGTETIPWMSEFIS
jgi:hypothetical protein